MVTYKPFRMRWKCVFFKPISDEVRLSQIIFNKHKKTMKLILVSIFACVAAILQAAPGFYQVSDIL